VIEEGRPKVVEKPWGSELWFAETDRYAGKLLRIEAGQALSVQCHERKDESAYLLSGRVVVAQGADPASLASRELGPGSSWRNRPGLVHSIEAVEDSVVIEVSSPELDDVVRFADRYGRADS
jgi:mannose-6-phosphate isomerase